jgi:uncharacterized RDD family membrane protein YckC/ribosomal protein L40E
MICSKCGAENDPDAENCIECGWGLRSRLAVDDLVCANHPGRFAAAVCHACGIEICEACEVFIDGIPYCKECAERPSEDVLLEHVRVVDPVQAEVAGFGTRVVATAIDWLILGCSFLILWVAFWLLFGDPSIPLRPEGHRWEFAAFWMIVAISTPIYFIYSIGTNGYTPGMASMDIVVVRQSGEAIDYQTAIVRYLAILPSIISVAGIFWSLWDRQGRMLHDRLSRTRVVKLGSGI